MGANKSALVVLIYIALARAQAAAQQSSLDPLTTAVAETKRRKIGPPNRTEVQNYLYFNIVPETCQG